MDQNYYGMGMVPPGNSDNNDNGQNSPADNRQDAQQGAPAEGMNQQQPWQAQPGQQAMAEGAVPVEANPAPQGPAPLPQQTVDMPQEAAPVQQAMNVPQEAASTPQQAVNELSQSAVPQALNGQTSGYGQPAAGQQVPTGTSAHPLYGSGPQGQGQPPQGAPYAQASWQPYGAPRPYTPYGQQSAPLPYGTQPQQQPPQNPSPRKGGKALSTVALLMACAVFAFGGTYAANQIEAANEGTTVVYRAPETTTADQTSTGDSLTVSEIAAKTGQSVVSVVTETAVESPFVSSDQTVSGAGSGVIISEDGYIITNNHVVEGATKVDVTLPDGSEHEATIIGTDSRSDIAVIKINVTGLIPAVIGDNEAVRVGDLCVAIGNPMGQLGGTVTDGIISALNREVTISGTPMNLIQMSAAVSPGNSGGGLFNGNGELIGVVNAKAGSDNTEGLGFAIPANTAMQVAEELIEDGYVHGRPALGITAQQMNVQDSDSMTVVVVAQVSAGGAADLAGIQANDILLSLNGESISTLAGLSNTLEECAVGDTVTVEVQRDSTTLTLEVTLQELVPDTSSAGA